MLIRFGHFPSAAGFFSGVTTAEAEDMAAAAAGTTGPLFLRLGGGVDARHGWDATPPDTAAAAAVGGLVASAMGKGGAHLS